MNIEGLAAGSDGKSLLIGLRNPLTRDGRAIVVPLMNASALLSGSQGKRAELGEPILLDLGNKGIRSIEYVENKQAYLILAGPRDDGTDFTLYLWSGRPDDGKPSEVKGVAEILKRIPETFRPEAMTVNKESNRVLLVSDDGGRKFGGEDCKSSIPTLSASVRSRFRSSGHDTPRDSLFFVRDDEAGFFSLVYVLRAHEPTF